MSDLMLDPTTGDLLIKDGDFVIVGATNQEADLRNAIRQDLSTTLKELFSEWFLNTLEGLPVFEYILIKNANPTIIDGILKDAILGVSGVLGLESFAMKYLNDRSFQVDFQARGSTGPIVFSEVIAI